MKDRHEGMKDRPGYCSFCPLLLALLQCLPRFVVVLPDGGLTSSFLLLGKMNGPLLLFLVVESTRTLQHLKSCGFTDT